MATGSERQLTVDGEPYMSWGKLPDSGLIVIQIKKHGLKMPPVGAQFSPDDRYLVASLNDERKVETVPFVEWVPTDGSLRPIVLEVRHPYTGDQETSESSLWVIVLCSPELRYTLPEAGVVSSAEAFDTNKLNTSNSVFDILKRMIPTNPVSALANGDMLGIIFFAIFFGIALNLSLIHI